MPVNKAYGREGHLGKRGQALQINMCVTHYKYIIMRFAFEGGETSEVESQGGSAQGIGDLFTG